MVRITIVFQEEGEDFAISLRHKNEISTLITKNFSFVMALDYRVTQEGVGEVWLELERV